MPGARLRPLYLAGLGTLAVVAMAPARAQTPPQLPAQGVRSWPTSAPVAAEARSQPVPGQVVMQGPAGPPAATEGGAVVPPRPVAGLPMCGAGGCSCGERHGLSRWWWHKTQCKRSLQECALGFPEEFNEWPLGSALYAHGRTEVANGDAARMVFYHYDFVEGTGQLNRPTTRTPSDESNGQERPGQVVVMITCHRRFLRRYDSRQRVT